MSQPLTDKPMSAATTSLADLCSYDRAAITTGIVHFGVGGFHRAHQAMYLDRLMARVRRTMGHLRCRGDAGRRAGCATCCGPGRPLHAASSSIPTAPSEPRVIGSIVDYLFAPDDPDAVVERLADPATRIVSLTVTEGGYNVHPVTGEFDAAQPDVPPDLGPAVPRTAFGLVTAAWRAGERRPGAVHRDVLRQHPGQRRRRPRVLLRVRRPQRPGPSAEWIVEHVRLPELDGRPDHAGHHRRRPDPLAHASASPTAGRWSASRSRSGSSRTTSRPDARRTSRWGSR